MPAKPAVLYGSHHNASRLRSLGQIRRLQTGSPDIVRTVDATGHVVKVTEPGTNGKPELVTDISYNQNGLVTKIVQHGHDGETPRVRTFTYDEKGHVISATSPEAGMTTYTYDLDGNIASKKDALGQTVTYTWDAEKRLLSKTFTDETAPSFFHYDENTKDHSSYLDMSGKHQSERIYTYDGNGRLTRLSMQTPGQNSATYTLGFRYDDSHRVKTITYPDGTQIQQAFTSTGLLKSVSQGKTVLFSKPEYFVPSGRIKAATLGNGIVLNREYDKHSRVSRMQVTSSAGSLLDESFEYTDSGSVRHITDNLKSSSDMRFGYDELQRVKTTEGAIDEAYVYDSFGNQALKAGGATSQMFDEHNRIIGGTGIAYDAAGEVTNDGVHSYHYDGNGLIDGVDGSSIRYFYDAEGNRIQKRMADGNHDYFWWNEQLLAERAPNGTWTDYVYVDGSRFASVRKVSPKDDAPVEVAYFVTAAVGTSRMKLSADGSVLTNGTFAPFGKPATPASEIAASISFSDEIHDTETGLDTYKFRSYNHRLGRWMSPDPSSLHFASLGNPQTYNLYAFVTNDPLKYIDVKGLCAGDGTGDDDGDCYIPPYDPCEYGLCDGGGDPPPDDPCAGADACVIANPDPDPTLEPNPSPPIALPPEPPPAVPSTITITIPPAVLTWASQQTTPVHGAWTYGNWCGSGGSGQAMDDLDASCMIHDYCYATNGLTAGMNWGYGTNSQNIGALKACNESLCAATNAISGAAATEVKAYFSTVPFGYCTP